MTSQRRRYETTWAAIGAAALLGCGKAPPQKAPVTARAEPKAVASRTAPKSGDAPTTSTAAPAETLPPYEYPADSPPGFRGEDQPADAPIPAEVQQDLQSYDEAALPKKIALLAYPHPQVRAKAAESLRYIGDALRPQATQALRGALRDRVPQVRKEAAESLENYKAAAVGALPELIPLIDDPDKEVAGQALKALAKLGPAAAPAVPRLLAKLRRPEPTQLLDTIVALGAIGPAAGAAAPDILAKMDKAGNIFDAVKALGRVGGEAELLECLTGFDAMLWANGAHGAGFLPKHGPALTARLIEVAGTESEYAAGNAVEALGKVRPTTPAVSAALLKAAKHAAAGIRRNAVTALGICEPKFDDAVPVLIAAGKDADEGVRKAATAALGNYKGATDQRFQAVIDELARSGWVSTESFLGKKDNGLEAGGDEFFPLLKKLAEDSQADELRRAIGLYGMRLILKNVPGGREAQNADPRRAELVATAERLLDDKEPPSVRSAAATVQYDLARRSDPRAVPAWLAGLKDGKFLEDRLFAMSQVNSEDNPELVPILVGQLDESDPAILGGAVRALQAAGPKAAVAVPKLIALASRPEDAGTYDNGEFLKALGAIGAHPELSVPFLEKQLDAEPKYWETCAASLALILVANDLDPKPLIARMDRLFDPERNISHPRMVQAYGKLGPKGAAAVPKIVAYIRSTDPEKDDDNRMRDYGVYALAEIGPGAEPAVPLLLEAAQTWKRPAAAIHALGKIPAAGPRFAAIVPKLFETVELRSDVLAALEALGKHGADAAPAVATLLDSRDESERFRALDTLRAMGPAAKAVVPRLEKAAKDDSDKHIRERAAETLKEIAPPAP